MVCSQSSPEEAPPSPAPRARFQDQIKAERGRAPTDHHGGAASSSAVGRPGGLVTPGACYALSITEKEVLHMTEINIIDFPEAQRRETLAPANRSNFADPSRNAASDLGQFLA